MHINGCFERFEIYTFLFRNLKRHNSRDLSVTKDNIKIDIKKSGYKGIKRIHMPDDRVQSRNFVLYVNRYLGSKHLLLVKQNMQDFKSENI